MRSPKWIIGLIVVLFLSELSLGQNTQTKEKTKYWIFFQDKGVERVVKRADLREGLELGISRRALERRGKVRADDNLIGMEDLPVASEYIRSLEALGLEPQAVSRWLNGVSAVIPPGLLGRVRALPFVIKVRPVATLIRKPIPFDEMKKSHSAFTPNIHTLDYGSSYTQNGQIHVPEVHDLGITGKGVLVGMIDTGFDHRGRSIFSHLDVVAEHDFHWNDDNTANEEDDPTGQHRHGTMTFSVIGGFSEGNLIGPAYGASFALAKTEWLPVTDLKIEEDHWIMAIEWLESIGADVVSSSLGYASFVDSPDYTIGDLDGNTSMITIAADFAVSNGVVVVNAAGNKDFWDKVNFPADGDDVIAVGAVNSEGGVTGFSSEGPTADGRIKPDVVAMGLSNRVLSPTKGTEDSFGFSDGTSFSCPLVAGVCALILQAHPELKPAEVRDALRETADRAGSPDNQYGWGLVNAYEAIFYHGMILLNFERVAMPAAGTEGIEVDILTKSEVISDSVFLFYRMDGETEFHKIWMYRVGGESVPRFRADLPFLIGVKRIQFHIKATDMSGTIHTAPYGAPDVLYSFTDSLAEIVYIDSEVPEAFELIQNYPNPFNAETTITFVIVEKTHVKLKIYNILGQEKIVLIDEVLEPGKKRVIWRGYNHLGQKVPSGVYICHMEAGGESQNRKMILVN